MGLLFLPAYIRFMGAEAYGLVGIAATLHALFCVLDMGVSGTIKRELARLSNQGARELEAWHMAATLETLSWILALLVGVLGAFLAPLIARYWVNPVHLSRSAVEQALVVIGVWIALRWPASLYSYGLGGLQRQVLLNVLNSILATVRGLGALLVLWLISPTILCFVIFQVAMLGCEITITRHFLWRELPRGRKRVWLDRRCLKATYRFSLGMTGINVTLMLLNAVDRIVLSKVLGLEEFGYYSLARTIAEMLGRAASPIREAVYPRLTALVAADASGRAKELYHRACQLTSVLVVPPALALICSSDTILRLWTRDAGLTEKTALVLSALSVGSYLWSLRLMPFSLQLAYGWTSLTFVQNIVALSVLTPLLWILARSYGMLAGGAFWILLNLGCTVIGTAVMHRRLLQGEYLSWLLFDALLPLLAGLCAVETLKFFSPLGSSSPQDLLVLLGGCGVSLAAALLTVSWPREMCVAFCKLLLAQFGLVKSH